MQASKRSNKGKNVVHRRNLLWSKEGGGEQQYTDSLRMVTDEGSIGRLYPRVTIDVLPDNVLLETFDFYLGKESGDASADEIDYHYNYDEWKMLVYVCCRWWCIVFASPHRLDLKVYCTRKQSVNLKALDIWPLATLPIVIYAEKMMSEEDVANVIGALRHHDRVCKISYRNDQDEDLLLEEFAAIDEPFPALTSLVLRCFGQNAPVLPDSFLGGSAPRLRSLYLLGIPYPSVGTLLSSTTDLVQLSLLHIPHAGYISPKTIVPCLSMLARLKSLTLRFEHPRSQDQRENRRPPPLTRVVFPNLTSLDFRGDIEYLEDILSQIETPVLNDGEFRLFNQLLFDTPLLGHFIYRMETFMTFHRALVKCFSSAAAIELSGRGEMANSGTVTIRFSCEPLDWQLSAVAQVLNSFSSSLKALERLDIIIAPSPKDRKDEIEDIQWREVLHPFTSVKTMTLRLEDSVRLVSSALQELTRELGERVTEVLPTLQNLFLRTYGPQLSSELVKKDIEQFIATRQLHGHPVTVHY